MTIHTMIANAVQRSIGRMFTGYSPSASAKHDHAKDFGWPDHLDFDMLYRMYTRNGLAAAGVDRTAAKTWESAPSVWESEKPAESEIEADIRKRFAKLRAWQMMQEADKRSMVGKYGAIILRLRDSKQFHEPVDTVPGGLDGIAEIIPAWEGQLTVGSWDMDPASEGYGKPTMFNFNEAAVGNESQPRSFNVHPDRVIIWSDDGTVNCRSILEPGFNDLIDAEKVKGAGGEGFWKSSRGAPIITAPADMTPQSVAEGMGVTVEQLTDAINMQIDSYNQGFDKGLLLGGMTATPMNIALPQPAEFFEGPVSSYAASIMMPVKILIGNQSGERASTEDAREWAQTCNSRRVNRCIPLIVEFIDRLVMWGILPDRDWHVGWDDLTEASAAEKMDRAAKMSDINSKTTGIGDDPPFLSDEIREAAGFKPLVDATA